MHYSSSWNLERVLLVVWSIRALPPALSTSFFRPIVHTLKLCTAQRPIVHTVHILCSSQNRARVVLSTNWALCTTLGTMTNCAQSALWVGHSLHFTASLHWHNVMLFFSFFISVHDGDKMMRITMLRMTMMGPALRAFSSQRKPRWYVESCKMFRLNMMKCAQFVFLPFPFSYLFAWAIHICRKVR